MSERSFGYFLGQAIVVVLGWVVVHWLSAKRDLSKARLEAISSACNGLIADASRLLTAAREYHIGLRSDTAEIGLKMALQDMSTMTLSLRDICDDRATLAQCRGDIATARRVITGSHFEDEHDAPLQATAPQLEEIAMAVLRVKQSLLKVKHSQLQDR